MPKVIKKKPVRKKIRQEEEVKSALLQTVDKVKEKQKQLFIAVSVVLAIVILYIGYSLYSSSRGDKAYALEKEAYQYYYGEFADTALTEQERWTRALELFKKSIEARPAPTTLFYAGNCYYNLKDYESAIKEYTAFISQFDDNKEILPLVYQKLLSSYLKTNQNDKALATIGELANIDGGIFRDTALILEARYYEGAGEKDKAIEKYKEIVSAFPDSPWSAEAGSRIPAEDTAKAVSPEKASGETPGTSEDNGTASKEENTAEQPEGK